MNMGLDSPKMKPQDVCHKISWTIQESFLVSEEVEENLLLPSFLPN